MKWLRRGLLALALLALLLAAVLGVYAWRALPQTRGTIDVAGPHASVRIERDANGIPTIRAGSVEDAMFGLGFVHAQDRLWQLETHERIAAGRLAEAFGRPRSMPTASCARSACAAPRRRSGPRRAASARRGRGLRRRHQRLPEAALHARPPEFVLLGLQPEPWKPDDSFAWAIMMAWDLGGNWSSELLRMRLALKLPVERINELLPPYPGEKPLPTADYAALLPRACKLDGKLGARRCARRPNRASKASARTTGSSPARTPRAASRCSPTTRT